MAAERILVKGVIQVLKLVIPVVAKTVGFTWSLKDDLKNLQETLEMIHAKIADAEEMKEKNNELRLWLKRLKDVAYDAEYVMDEFSYETMRLSERHGFKCKALDFASSSNPLAYRRNLTKKIKKINKRVDEIAKDMEKFHLQTTFNNTIIAHGESSEQRQTASLIIDSETVGRKDDKNRMVDMLITESTSSSSSSSSEVNYSCLEKISIISVVGMGGLGKTTLAQLVYNDELVIKHFEQRLWVCVSTEFDVKKVLIEIMESITQAKFDNLSNLDVLVNKVRKTLEGKKFLLVLDDLWNENFHQWESLKNPLLAGAQGSKILITTRNMQVEDVVKGDIPPYKLKGLQEDECWSIMEKRAFSPGGAVKIPNMINIGKEIAIKCCGLPLAAKFVGSLMYSKNKEIDWLSIKEKEIWNTGEGQNEIQPILKLSYDNLSPHLKQCFSYCTIFPKGCVISKILLIRIWMAEGFLGPTSNIVGNERSMEDIGEEYFDGLVWSSFLNVAEKNYLDDITKCKMHDLVHDLGRDVAGDRELGNISDIQRLCLVSDDDLSTRCAEALSELKKLRAVIILEPVNNMKGYTFSSNKKLRVLHFGESFPGITLPVASKLRHVRYLHLSTLNLKNHALLVQSISKLYHLQTLELCGCHHVQDVLSSIESLRNLRHLDISSTDIEELPDSVTSLSNLQTIFLNHCENFSTFPNCITGLQYLKHLNMAFTSIEELPGSIINLPNLQILEVNHCLKLKSLPEYVAGLSNLRVFAFGLCPLLEAFPKDIGALTQLRFLDLAGTAIRVLPEACGDLYNLESVNLFHCDGLMQVKNWTKLRKFYFQRNMVTPTGIGKLVFLQQLTYRVREQVNNELECYDGVEELANLNLLEGLAIADLQNVKDPKDAVRANIKGKQNLHQLDLYWNRDETEEEMMILDQKSCNDLQVFEALQPHSGLRQLLIHNFMGWDLPTWLCAPSGLSELYALKLKSCRGIKQLPASIGQLPRHILLELIEMESLKSLDITGFPSLTDLVLIDMFLLEELSASYPSSCLKYLKISGCESLTEIPSFRLLVDLELEKVNHKLVWAVGRSQISSLTKLIGP